MEVGKANELLFFQGSVVPYWKVDHSDWVGKESLFIIWLHLIQELMWPFSTWSLLTMWPSLTLMLFTICVSSVSEATKQMASDEVSKRFWPPCLCWSWTSWRERRFYCFRAVLKLQGQNSTSAGLQVFGLKICLHVNTNTHTCTDAHLCMCIHIDAHTSPKLL